MLLSCEFQTSSNVENLHPQIIKQVVKELTSLSSDPPEGIKVFTNEEDVTDIQATIEGPGRLFSLFWGFERHIALHRPTVITDLNSSRAFCLLIRLTRKF